MCSSVHSNNLHLCEFELPDVPVDGEIHWFLKLQDSDIIFDDSLPFLYTVAVVGGVTKVPHPGCELKPFSNGDIMLS